MNYEQLLKPVLLGEIDVPSGELLIVDPGLGNFWQHDENPRSRRDNDPERFDLEIVGSDAVAAGRAYDRQFDPRYLYDVENIDKARKHFSDFVTERQMRAQLNTLSTRVPHLQRARLAMDTGGGAGVVQFNNLWAVAVRGLPNDRSLPIVATPMPDGEFVGKWRSIDIVIDSNTHVSRTATTTGVAVEHGQLICADLQAFGAFRMWHSLDGLADFVFWGRGAADVANKFDAAKVDGNQYGWLNLSIEEIRNRAQAVQDFVDKNDLKFAVDYRPHCNLEKLNAQIRSNENEFGQLLLDNSKACGFSNRWGDGIFDISSDFDASGRIVRIRIDVGSEKQQSRVRRLRIRAQGAVATKKILVEEQHIHYAERMEPSNSGDSGWAFSAGTETDDYMEDSQNFAVVSIASLLQRDPALEAILTAPIGSVFRRESNGYVPDV